MVTDKQISRRELLLDSAPFIMVGGVLGLFEELIRTAFYVRHSSYRYVEHPVEQVFRDHDGVRTFFTDADNRVVEYKYYYRDHLKPSPDKEIASRFRNLDDSIAIYNDLPNEQRGFAKVLLYNHAGIFGGLARDNCVEIHRPRNSLVSPGNETYGGKFKTDSQMGEIK